MSNEQAQDESTQSTTTLSGAAVASAVFSDNESEFPVFNRATDLVVDSLFSLLPEPDSYLTTELRMSCVAFLTRRFTYGLVINEDESGAKTFVLVSDLDSAYAPPSGSGSVGVPVSGAPFAIAGCPLHDQFGMSALTLASEIGATLPWLLLAVTRRRLGVLTDDINDMQQAFDRLRMNFNDFRDQSLMLVQKSEYALSLELPDMRGLLFTLSQSGVVSLGDNDYAPGCARDGLVFVAFLLVLYSEMAVWFDAYRSEGLKAKAADPSLIP